MSDLAAEALTDAAFVRAMMRVEAVLAAVQAEAGLVPAEHAELIAEACRGPLPDPAALATGAAATATPVVPLLEALRARLPEAAAASLHHRATSQDIVDSAAMLNAAGALRMVLADLEHAAAATRQLAQRYTSTPVVGRTLLQHARPTTFGAKAAGWLLGLETAIAAVVQVRDERVSAQLGGPVGTLEEFGPRPERLVAAFAERLGLDAPEFPWHAERSRVVQVGGALCVAAAVVGKIAVDLLLLAQTEVGEVVDDDPAQGGSSSMPHKRNPVAAVMARAAAMRAPGLLANLVTAAASGEHERAAGAWQAEWPSLRELLIATGSAAGWLRQALEHVAVDEERMRRNLELTGVFRDSEPAVAAATRLAERVLERPMVATARPTQVHHVADGAVGRPVVVLGGSLGSTLAMWDPILPALAEHFRVIRYDLRGHGLSPTPPGPYVIDDLGADLLDLLDRLGESRVHLVGSSIGAMAAMWLAAHAPERVGRLVVIGSSARLGPAEGWIERARTVLVDGTASISDAVTRRWVTQSFADAHPDALGSYREMLAAADPAGYAGCCMAIAGMDLRRALGSVTASTLVIVGSDDAATPRAHGEEIVKHIPGARLAVVPQAAHLPSVERPHEIVRLLLEHLA